MRRDLEVMELLVERRAETLDWLHERCFNGLSRKRAMNRLGDLVAAGYLHRVSLEVLDQLDEPARRQSVYTLGPKARKALELRSLTSEHFLNRRWNPTLRDSSIPHQIVVNRVCELLRADAVPEHLLPTTTREQVRHKPDATWERPPPPESHGTTVLLEVDLGHYSRERILGKYQAFTRMPEADVLLIVAPTTERTRKVSDWLHAAGAGDVWRTGREVITWSLDDLLWDRAYWADRFGSNPLADHTDPEAHPFNPRP